MDTQTGAATGLFGLSLDTLKLSSADYTQLCGLWVGRVQFLSDRYLKDSEDVHPAWHAFPVPPDHVELLQALIRNGEALSSHIAAGSHWAVLCTGTKRLEALRSAFAAAPENQRSLLIRKLAADLDHRLKLSADVKWLGFVPPLYRRALSFIWLNCPAEALIAEILKLPVLLPKSAHFPYPDINLVEITDAAWDVVADDAAATRGVFQLLQVDVTHGDDLEAGKLAGAVSWLYPVDCWQARRVVGTLAKHEAAFESLLTAVQTFEHVQSRVSLTWQVRMEHEKDGR